MSLKFLLDENVHHNLYNFLKKSRFDVKIPRKGLTDTEISKLSLKENRILITNDSDFEVIPKKDIYSVIILKIPQSDIDLLTNSFTKLLNKKVAYKGKLIEITKQSLLILSL